MTPLTKRVAWLVISVVGVLLSFAVGRWSGSLQNSLKSEAGYPWDLHRKIGSVDLSCEKLLNKSSIGQFYVQSQDDGATLIVASFNKGSGTVIAFALSLSGRVATDKWPLECN